MTETTVRSILRIVAVITILVGVTMSTSTVFMLIGATGAMRGGLNQDLVFATLVPPFVIVVEGLLLWGISPGLARRIVA